MKRKGRNNILSREKNGKFKSVKRSCDPSLRICQHCLFNENNVMRRGPDGQKNLCNACGLFWKKTVSHFANKELLKDLGMGRRNLSIDQSDLEPLIDVNITGLEGELPVIQNEQGISEDPLKAIATEGSNNHALYPRHEELPESLEHLTYTLGIDHSSQNDDEQPMKSYTFSEALVKVESLLAFHDMDFPSTSEVDHTSVVGISR